MTFERTEKDGKMILAMKGMIDFNSAAETNTEIKNCIALTDDLTLDFKDVEYVSSAGLRVILQARDAMEGKGRLTLINVNEELMDTFDITGFLDILNIE